MMGRECAWIARVVLISGLALVDIALGQESLPPSGPVISQPEVVQPRLAPRRRVPRARRYAIPRSKQSRPRLLPEPATEVAPASQTGDAKNADNKAAEGSETKDPKIARPSELPSLMLAPPSRKLGTPAPYSTKLNLNRATLEQIQRLPGMTPGMAAHILAGRPFREMSDLAQIGVPFEVIEKIAPAVTIEP